MSGRIRLHESSNAAPEQVITALWRDVFGDPAEGDRGPLPAGDGRLGKTIRFPA